MDTGWATSRTLCIVANNLGSSGFLVDKLNASKATLPGWALVGAQIGKHRPVMRNLS